MNGIDTDVMKRRPRPRSESLTDHRFLRTMAFAVYFHVSQSGTMAQARSQAFAVLVFAELLRAFGAHSETKPVWRIAHFSNLNLIGIVGLSIGIQFWSQHNATLGRFLKTSSLSFTDGCVLLAIGAVPLLVLELAKVIRLARAKESTPFP